MKPGDTVWVRVGLDRYPVQGVLASVDLAAREGQVILSGLRRGMILKRTVTRDLKRIHAKRPKSQRDKLR